MDLVNDPLVREIWVMKSAQVGWTEILLNIAGYFIDLDPSPILLVQPTLEIAEAFSKDRLAPMIRDTPAMHGRIADARSRDSGNTLLHKKFNGGHLTLAGANSPQGLRSRPIRILLCDEVDGYPTSAGPDGDPFALARKRTTAFWNRKILAGSTPTIKGSSRVEAGYLNSDQRQFHFPCPHCGRYQRLVWAQVKWTELDLPPEQAVYQCVHCSGVITEGQRQEILPKYRCVPTKEFNGIAGLHVHEIMSPFVTLGEMATSFIEARKLPETFQTWVNTALGETYEDTSNAVEPEGLLARRDGYNAESIPADVALLTLGVDTQDDRLEAQLLGWGRDEECWVIEQVVFRGDPVVAWNKGVWKELSEYRRRRFMTEDGRALVIQGTGVDFGGHYSQQVANYAYRCRFQRVFAVKGLGGGGRLIWPRRPGKTKLSKADLYGVGVDTAKDVLYGRLAKVTVPGPGYIHLPATVDEEFCEQLTSEKKFYKKALGRRVGVWRPKLLGSRQEAQDCWIYGYAVMLGRNIDLAKLADAIERRRETKAGDDPDRPTPRKARPAAAKDKPATVKKGRRKRRVVRSNYLTRK
jgi:phage terminase large subunit GpA-like protein